MRLRDLVRAFWRPVTVPAEQVAEKLVVREIADLHADLERRIRLLEAEAGVLTVDDKDEPK